MALGDLQILRLGANLIDQADADSYPTVIAYSPAGTLLYAYGIEDLPYINALAFRSVPDSFWKSGFVDPGSAGAPSCAMKSFPFCGILNAQSMPRRAFLPRSSST